MKFIVDAQLPIRLKDWLISQGYDSIHTEDIAVQTNKEPKDSEIADWSFEQNRIVISKDKDFLKLYLLNGKPSKLLLVKTGNIINKELIEIFKINFPVALRLFNSYDVVEMSKSFVIGHGQ